MDMDETLKNEEQIAVDNTPALAAKKRKMPLGSKGGKKRRSVRILAVLLAVAALVWGVASVLGGKAEPAASGYVAAQAVRRDLTVSVSGSATLEPADSYQVTTLISGEIESAPFEEGDLVTQGALLYAMDSGDARSSVSRANISVEQAKLSYAQAQEALQPTVSMSGTLNEVYAHNGDSVTAGTALAKIVASTDVTIDFLFPYVEPGQFYVGQSATVFVGNFDGPVQGSVVSVSNSTSITSNGMEGSSVRVKVNNPGVLSDAYTASAVIGSYCSYGNAPVTMPDSVTVYASGSGSVTGFDKLAGSTVQKGEVLCTIESDANRQQLENARLTVESSRLSASTAADAVDDYKITSPISGTVIEKDFKAGDKVDGAGSGTLAVIYDLSSLKMKMNVNELDIAKVRVGQTVEVTAAALPGQIFTGRVEKVSVNGTTTNGFTTYPVTITVSEYGGLKPGMNVSATILCETAENVLCVPVGAVERGNTVLVPGEGAMAEDGTAVADLSKVEERTVSLGFNDEAYIEITYGLEEGDTVLIPTGADEMGG